MKKAILIYGQGEKVELELGEIAKTLQYLEEEGELIHPKLYY